MKPKFSTLFLLAFIIGGLLTINVNAQVTKKKITVDGSMLDWATIQQDTVGTVDGNDHSVFYKMAWDEDNLYFNFHVLDDTAGVYGRAPFADDNFWTFDLVEVFLDMDNSDSVWSGSGGANYDGVNDYQLRFFRDTLVKIDDTGWPNIFGTIPGLSNSPGVNSPIWGKTYQDGFAGMGVNVEMAQTDTSYFMEIEIPFSFLTKADDNLSPSDFMDGHEFGLRINAVDKDTIGEGTGKVFPDGSHHKDPSSWATVTLEAATEPVIIDAANASINVDGETDDWSEITGYMLGEDNAPDLSVNYKFARDNFNLYLLLEVEDDTASILGRGEAASAGFWEVDNLELFLDMDNSKNVKEENPGSPAYDDNDFQLRFHRDTLVEITGSDFPNVFGTIPYLPNTPGVISEIWDTSYYDGFAGLGLTVELVETAGGYIQEIAIPFSFLSAADSNLAPADFIGETEIGIRIQVTDMDSTFDKMSVAYPAGSHWKKPQTWGTLALASAEEEVSAAMKKINIDGSSGEWGSIEGYDLTENGSDLTVDYKLAWDYENLYFMFEVVDDTAAILGRGAYSEEASWAVDNIELFLDMDNSKNPKAENPGPPDYDDNDFQLRIHRDTMVVIGTDGWPNTIGTIPELENSPNTDSEIWGKTYQDGFAGLGITIVEAKTDSSYTKEIAVPFEFLTKADPNLTPDQFMAGSEIGIRIQVRDMDAVGEHMASAFPDDSHWKKPLTWATMTLEEGTEPVMLTAKSKTISVDGDFTDWEDVDAYMLGENNAPDLSIKYKIARDTENLYVMFDIEDDTAAVLGRGDYADEGTWAVDNVELFLDMDNSKNVKEENPGPPAYDDSDFQLRFHRDTLVEVGASGWPNNYGTIPGLPNTPGVNSDVWGTDYQSGFAGLGVMIEQVETETGYMEEIAIPFSFLTKADDNLSPANFIGATEIGIRIQVRDMDSVSQHIAVDYPVGSHWKKPNTWGTLKLEAPITLDGKIDPIWDETPRMELNTIINPDLHAPHSVDDEDDFSGYFKIRWNESALYVLAVVKDDSLVTTDNKNESDNLSVDIDPENIKNYSDPGHMLMNINMENERGGRTAPGWNNPPYFETAINITDSGYIAEYMIPADSIRNPAMEAGTMIGIDVKINDVDDPANIDRDQLGWNDPDDLIWRDPFRYGTIELLADGTVKGYKSPAQPQNFTATVNERSVELTWDAVEGAEGYYLIDEIADAGIVYEDTLMDPATTSLTMDNLENGVYEYILVAYAEGDVRSTPDPSVTFEINVVGIDDNLLQEISVYPNPIDQWLTIEGRNIQLVEVVDITGKVIITQTSGTSVNSIQVNLLELSSGIYNLRIKTDEGEIVKQIIKK